MPKGQPLDLSSGTKECPRCKQTKALADFHKNKTTIHGYNVYCKVCSYQKHNRWRKKNKKYAAEQGRKWRKDNPERFKDHCLKYHRGLPLGSYQEMLTKQNGKCAICEREKPNGQGRFHVDHCHDTGKIRGLLCSSCNLALGHFQHNPRLLVLAVDYLAKSAVKS